MSRKRILIIIPGFKHGGTNRSLFNLLSIIDKDRYDINVFGMSPNGYYKDLLKDQNVLREEIFLSALMSNLSEEKSIKRKIFFTLIKILVKLFSFLKFDMKDLFYKSIGKKQQFQQYDTIVAFQEGDSTLFVSKIECKNKIAWIHCNYVEYLKYLNIGPEISIYKNFASIVCVSNYTKKVFSDLMPELSERVYAIHNTLNIDSVIKQSINADLSDVFKSNIFNIISVGRIDTSKRFSAIPEIIYKLKNKGFVFKWFLLGGVNHIEEGQNLLANIKKYDVQDYLYCLGEVDNPYPYIANSNLLVSTSISEAFPYVLIEAKALGIPVLVTDFGSAEECVKVGEEGIISPIEKISDALEQLINDHELYNSIKVNLADFQYDNSSILQKVYEIL